MSDPIKAALDAAGLAVNGMQDCEGPEGYRACNKVWCPCRRIGAAAIAAFLRALPRGYSVPLNKAVGLAMHPEALAVLADHVEATHDV